MATNLAEFPAPRRDYILRNNPVRGRNDTVVFDEEYVRRLAAGDPLIERHFCAYFGELILIKLRGRVRSRELIEDIRQDTFLRVLKNIRANGIEHPERLGGYVLAVCNNVMLEFFRSESRFSEMNEESTVVLESRPGADETFVTAERKQHVLKILKELPEKDAELLRLIFLEEADKDGVCRRFGVDRDYLRVLLHRARGRFKELYSRSYAATF
ncbi:MAG: sigma-70 family RNA polymerase sigma factor [Acidobacteriota bacterium]|nr:sigma-70 family RNA polymerase sigma factor [Acidobacteriota bacterium]